MSPFFEKIRNEILSSLACLIINFVALTSRKKSVHKERLEKAKSISGNIIYAFWHGRQFMLVYEYKNKGVVIMSSLSRDGQLQTLIMTKMGYEVVRGSSGKRGAVEGTLEMITRIEQGKNIAFAVDGPTGPGFQPKPGIIYLAQKTQKAIIPLTSSVKNRKVFNNWDKYMLPFPFNKSVVVYGNPVIVGKQDDLNLKAEELKNELNAITEEADRIIEEPDN